MLGEMDPCSQTRGEIWKKRCSGDIVHFFKSVNEEMIHPMKDVKLQPQQFRKNHANSLWWRDCLGTARSKDDETDAVAAVYYFHHPNNSSQIGKKGIQYKH